MKRIGPILLVGGMLLLAGCVERRLTITSEPSGALVTVNSKEVGRTPDWRCPLGLGSIWDFRRRSRGVVPDQRRNARLKALVSA
jgi:hypothetical protein